MKVALVGDRPPPFGGIAVHVEALATELASQGHTVELVDTARPGSMWRFGTRLAALAARGFLIHVHTSGHNPKSWALVAACGLARAPLHHNLVTLHSGLLPGYLAGAPARKVAARSALAGFGRIVAVSAAVRHALAMAGVSHARMMELPAFWPGSVRPGRPTADALAIRERFRPLLSCAVAPSPVYGLRVLASALALLRRRRPELGCVVFGPSSKQLVDANDPGVVALGEFAHAQALAVMKQSDAFVRPTSIDGDALSVREALALGVRTVASDAARRPEGVRVFRTGDPFSLAEAIELALAQPRPEPRGDDALPRLIQIYRDLSRAVA
ncbi:MAG: glycosyltransferase family 4 protein [Deltaproteobacteria bacterium]|nr:glycosyltransferase family 4 protein [Deltaproteobacteria bacterium]